MTAVNSVGGPIDSGDLGPVLMHEHVVLGTPGIKENWPDLWDREGCLSQTIDRFRAIEATEYRTLVDVTTADMGRDIGFLRDLQAATRINIVSATGIYWNIPFYWQGRSADAMADAFISEIAQGIAGTTVHAGIIKLATHVEFNALNETCLRGGARAHRATGVPITTHTFPQEMGREQQRVFKEEGVDLSRVVIGHQGDQDDLDYYKELMDAGSCIGIDHFGVEEFPNRTLHGTAGRAAVVAQLCADGYSDRIVLSQDAQACHDWGAFTHFPPGSNPEWNYTHLSRNVLPLLRASGVTDEQIRAMTAGNARRLFESQSPY
jgi:phosphotriesterase-related protein